MMVILVVMPKVNMIVLRETGLLEECHIYLVHGKSGLQPGAVGAETIYVPLEH